VKTVLSLCASACFIFQPLHVSAGTLSTLAPGQNEIHIRHDNQSRRLLITTPARFDRQRRYPVLFCFHGAGGTADGPSRRWSPHANRRELIVISAEAVQPLAKWNFTDGFHTVDHKDVDLIADVTRRLIQNRTADPRAIYATGHSSGGLFCYRLARESTLFAALAPMSCGMAKGAHDPTIKTRQVSIMQVIGDRDKSFHGTSSPKITMYSATQRIDIWRTFNRCSATALTVTHGNEIVIRTHVSESGIQVAYCKVKGQGHILRRDLRDRADSLALDFLLKHRRQSTI